MNDSLVFRPVAWNGLMWQKLMLVCSLLQTYTILYNEHLWVDKFQKVNPLIEDTVDNKDS